MPYPLDPTGIANSNLVVNEQHSLSTVGYNDFKIIVPLNAPFFVDNFTLSLNVNGVTTPLVLGVDYSFAAQFIGGTRSIGKPIYGLILLNPIHQVGVATISYQALGDVWAADAAAVVNTLLQLNINPRLTTWDNISGVQRVFPVINHTTVYDPATSTAELVKRVNELAVMLINKPKPVLRVGGPYGPMGPSFLSGIVNPTTEGVDGDYYLNLISMNLFFNTLGVWSGVIKLVGPTGDTGFSYGDAPMIAANNALIVANDASHNAAITNEYALSLTTELNRTLTIPETINKYFNANILSCFIYDTLADSDRGLWRFKCDNHTWYKESTTATGKWLGEWKDETGARSLSRNVLGDEVVVNGGFDTDISGWTYTVGSAIWDAGRITMTGNCKPYQILNLKAGNKYEFSIKVLASYAGAQNLRIGTTLGGVQSFYASWYTTIPGIYRWVFTAATDIQYLLFEQYALVTDSLTLDDISIREILVNEVTEGDYFYNTTLKKFYSLLPTTGVTEVFRGSRNDFPERVYITVETARIVLWDALDMSMWMVFLSKNTGWWGGLISSTVVQSIKKVVMLNGTMGIIGSADCGLVLVDFATDISTWLTQNVNYGGIDTLGIASRNTTTNRSINSGTNLPTISLTACNDIAMTVLPDAIVNTGTGLPELTVAVCNKNVDIISMSSKKIVRLTYTTIGVVASVFFKDRRIYFGSDNSIVNTRWVTGMDIPLVDTLVSDNYYFPGNQDEFISAYKATALPGFDLHVARNPQDSIGIGIVNKTFDQVSGSVLGIITWYRNQMDPDRTRYCIISNVINTGILTGSTVLSILNDTSNGNINSSDIVPDPTFFNPLLWTLGAGWTISSGTLTATNATLTTALIEIPSLKPGMAYKLTYTVSAVSALGVAVALGGMTSMVWRTAPGTYTEVLIAGAANKQFTFKANNPTSCSITFFSIIEVVNDISSFRSSLDIYGVLDKLPVNTGCDLQGVSGFMRNYFLDSELFGGVGGTIVTPNAVANPVDGLITASLINGISSPGVLDYPLWQPGRKYLSWYVKPVGATTTLAIDHSGTGLGVLFTFSTQIWSGYTGYLFPTAIALPNGWFRVMISLPETYWPLYYGTTCTFNTIDGGYIFGKQYNKDSINTSVYNRVKYGVLPTPDYIRQPYNANLDFPGDFYISCWLSCQCTLSGVSPSGVILTRAPTVLSGNSFEIAIVNGGLSFNKSLAGGMFIISYALLVLPGNSSKYCKIDIIRRGGIIYAYLNGVKSAATLPDANDYTNTSAVLTVGNSYDLTKPLPGQITLLNMGNSYLTDAEIQHNFELELELFKTKALACLQDTSPSVACMDYNVAAQATTVSLTNNINIIKGISVVASFPNVWPVNYTYSLCHQGDDLIIAGGYGMYLKKTGTFINEVGPMTHSQTKPLNEISEVSFIATAGQTDFILGKSDTTVLSVSVNGVWKYYGKTFDYRFMTNSIATVVRFNIGLAANAKVSIFYKKG